MIHDGTVDREGGIPSANKMSAKVVVTAGWRLNVDVVSREEPLTLSTIEPATVLMLVVDQPLYPHPPRPNDVGAIKKVDDLRAKSFEHAASNSRKENIP